MIVNEYAKEKITWIEPYFDLILNKIPLDTKTVLDVGCGSGVFGFIISKTRNCKIFGIEPFDYDLSHYSNIFRGTWKEFFLKNKSAHFDIIIVTETIEHMERGDALNFLEEAKTITDRIIVVTPYKWQQQPAYDNNQFQVHKSLITAKDLKNAGYDVSIIGKISSRYFSSRFYTRYNLVTKSFLSISNLVGVYESRMV